MHTLPIKKKWFDMILSGEKKEEYRELKAYYDSRLLAWFGAILINGELLQGVQVPEEIRRAPVQHVIFRNGYGRNCPECLVSCTLAVGEGHLEWGAEPGVKYYILNIQKVQEIRKAGKEGKAKQ